MNSDNRKHPRFTPRGLIASITIDPPPPDKEITLEGTIIDMSYTGIKIKLTSAMPADVPDSEIKINLITPESGIPITIHGMIKHLNDQSECGVHYSKKHPEHEVDDLMFECIKSAHHPIKDKAA